MTFAFYHLDSNQVCIGIWTGEHQEIGQEDALDWMVELKQLKTLEVVIEDSNLHRRVTRSIATRRLASAATRDENIDLFKVINAEKLMKLRGLERMSFTLRFRDQADITRWQAAAWFTRFKEVVGTMARAPKVCLHKPYFRSFHLILPLY